MIRGWMAALAAAALMATPVAMAETKNPKPKTIQLNEHMEWPMATGCRYSADVKGTVKSRGTAELFDPNIAVVAEVKCKDSAALRTNENIASVGPLSHIELEERLERRATVANPGGGCVYVPDFKMTNERLETTAVRFLCDRGK